MAVDLNNGEVTIPSYKYRPLTMLTGMLVAGKTLKIEWSPDGAEIASGTVPDGKVWEYEIAVVIKESDA